MNKIVNEIVHKIVQEIVTQTVTEIVSEIVQKIVRKIVIKIVQLLTYDASRLGSIMACSKEIAENLKEAELPMVNPA